MARRADGRVNSIDRTNRSARDTYEDGNAVRRLAAQPQERPEEAQHLRPSVSSQTRRNRARATQISAGYAIFLAVVCILCVAACVAYVKLQTVVTTQAEDITSKEKELSDLKADNDAYYNTTVASEDLEAVKEAAKNRLGMKYADESQVIYFDDSENSYVRQYQDVPDAK
ncbi:hypothetical protein [Fusicatenibacter sp.]